MFNSHRIICSFVPESDFADVTHDTETDRVHLWTQNSRSDGVTTDVTTIEFTRAQAHELHAFLGEVLGLSTPTPKAPLTASRAAEGAAKASRNRSWDVV